MRNGLGIIIIGLSTAFFSCNTEEKKEEEIVSGVLDYQLRLEQDTSVISSNEDDISQRLDSIINGQLNTRIISTGQKNFDLNDDGIYDIGFEIIDLRDFNGRDFPSYFDTLAARVLPYTVQISDNSTYGYCTALDTDSDIKEDEYWSDRESFVLGTIGNAGQFQGEGQKYLAFRFNENSYGWIKLSCSASSSELILYEYAYNKNGNIKAGQK